MVARKSRQKIESEGDDDTTMTKKGRQKTVVVRGRGLI